MKKIQKTIYIVFFFAAVLLPTLLTIFGVESPNYEKRTLAAKPVLMGEDGINAEYTQDFDDYFADNFALRPYFVTAYSKLLKDVFQTSAVPSIVVGKDNSLFLTATVDDFQGQNEISEEDLMVICEKLKTIQTTLESQGIQFIFVSAPNKNTIYPEDMPGRYIQTTEPTNFDRLYEMLDAYGVNTVYLKDVLVEAKNEDLVYYDEDSHWNNFGAVVGYTEIMKKTTELLPGFSYVDFTSVPYQVKRTMDGGSARMLFPSGGKKDLEMVYDFEKTYTSERVILDTFAANIETENSINDTRALVFRDSFFNAQVQFFSESFGFIKYTRSVPYDISLATEMDADIVILEIVERNILLLLNNIE